MIELDAERDALEVMFRALVGDWRLGTLQTADFLAVPVERIGLDGVPRWKERACDSDRVAEHRMRLLLELDRLLPSITNGQPLWFWLRLASVPVFQVYIDPIAFLSGPIKNLQALTSVLRQCA